MSRWLRQEGTNWVERWEIYLGGTMMRYAIIRPWGWVCIYEYTDNVKRWDDMQGYLFK